MRKKVNKIFNCPSPEKFGTQIQSVPYHEKKEKEYLLGVLVIGKEIYNLKFGIYERNQENMQSPDWKLEHWKRLSPIRSLKLTKGSTEFYSLHKLFSTEIRSERHLDCHQSA